MGDPVQLPPCPDGDEALPLGSLGRGIALNAFYLQEEATRALRRGDELPLVVEKVLSKAAALGARAIRTNGFNDGSGDAAIQVAPLRYDEVALRGLDLVLSRAASHGLRLVLPLGNYWDDYGGARRYVAWAGLPSPRRGDPRFFTEPRVVEHYQEHVAKLLDRRSSLDGFRLGEHPAVLAWELLNEPRGRCLDRSGETLRRWVDAVGAVVKRGAPTHLVGTGEEGLEEPGTSFRLNSASPCVDFASVHLYPDVRRSREGPAARAGELFLEKRSAVARSLGKPLVVGELGLRGDGPLTLEGRRAVFRRLVRCAWHAGVAVVAPWLFADEAWHGGGDPHAFYWHDGTSPADPRNRYADLVVEAARLFEAPSRLGSMARPVSVGGAT